MGDHERLAGSGLIATTSYGAGNTKLGALMVADAKEAGKYGEETPWLYKKSLNAIGKDARTRLEVGITGLKELQHQLKTAVSRGWLKSLDGRVIKIRHAHAALNTLLQSGGAVLMKHALVIFHTELAVEKGWVEDSTFTCCEIAYLVNVHDEQQLETDPTIAEEVGKMFAEAIRLAGERLKLRCRITGSYSVGNNWKDTH